MNEFFYYADEYLEEDDNAFLSGLLLEPTVANSVLESSPTNLEDILSFAIIGNGFFPDFGEQINVYSNENPVMARASGSCVIPKNRIGQS